MFYEKKAAEKLSFEQATKNLREDAETSRVLDEAILNKDADRVAQILFHSAWYTQAGSMTRGVPRSKTATAALALRYHHSIGRTLIS
tara:strand:+ start:201 stop:461 length:261 start_codon:yes stop_codon:yes gene_type:complete